MPMIPFIDFHSHKPSGYGVVSVLNTNPDDQWLFSDASHQMVSTGLHPWKIPSHVDLEALHSQLTYLAGYRNVVALGEAGLDKSLRISIELQTAVLEVHIRVSEQLHKPLILHCVRAYQEMLSLRKKTRAVQPWIFHGFNGPAQLAMQCLKENCLLSFGKAILHNNSRATHSLLQLDVGSFFLETDDATIDIERIYEYTAFLKNIDVDALKEHTFALFKKTFPNTPL